MWNMDCKTISYMWILDRVRVGAPNPLHPRHCSRVNCTLNKYHLFRDKGWGELSILQLCSCGWRDYWKGYLLGSLEDCNSSPILPLAMPVLHSMALWGCVGRPGANYKRKRYLLSLLAWTPSTLYPGEVRLKSGKPKLAKVESEINKLSKRYKEMSHDWKVFKILNISEWVRGTKI